MVRTILHKTRPRPPVRTFTQDLSRKDFTLSDINTEASAVSRRTLMKTAAGAGVAAAAVGIVGVAHASGAPKQAATATLAGAPLTVGETAQATAAGPIVVHVTDVRAGTLEVFADDSRTQIHDVDLAARIARAAR